MSSNIFNSKSTNKPEFAVINVAQRAMTVMFSAVEKAPRRYHATIAKHLLDAGTSLLTNIFLANEVRVSGGKDWQLGAKDRQRLQLKAMKDTRMISFLATILKELPNGLLAKQLAEILRLVYRCQKLLSDWMKSDVARYSRLESPLSKTPSKQQ